MDLIRKPVRFKKFYSDYKNQSFALLDIGCGNRSPSQTKKWFPSCTYHGVDKLQYNIDHLDLKAMDRFYQLDLENNELDLIPDDSYDVILMSHVLEHLQNPYDVLKSLCSKLKKGGKIYIEFPSLNSLGLSSMEGSLQFCDDSTHIFLPNPYEVANVLLKQGIKIKKGGIRRDWIRLMMSPLFLLNNLRRRALGKKPKSRGLWDLTGFAFYIYGEKNQ